jgi:hypothetical protein
MPRVPQRAQLVAELEELRTAVAQGSVTQEAPQVKASTDDGMAQGTAGSGEPLASADDVSVMTATIAELRRAVDEKDAQLATLSQRAEVRVRDHWARIEALGTCRRRRRAAMKWSRCK